MPSVAKKMKSHSIHSHNEGFTLLELIVVMLILAAMTGAVIPVLRGSLIETRAGSGVSDLAAMMKYAQSRAVTDVREYRVYFSEEENGYWLMVEIGREEGATLFEDLDEREGEFRRLPEGLEYGRLRAATDRQLDAMFITFYPSGASDVASIEIERIGGSYSDRHTISTSGSLSSFDIEEPDKR
jgi:prepilin-type N-terminal cleavage/methylation domain-containing protein